MGRGEGELIEWNLLSWYQQLKQDGISMETHRKDTKYRSNHMTKG